MTSTMELINKVHHMNHLLNKDYLETRAILEQRIKELEQDAKRYRFISDRFNETKASRCRNMLDALSIDFDEIAEEECEDLHFLIDRAMSEVTSE